MMHMQYRQETSAMNNETFICDAETIKQSMQLKTHQESSAIIWIVQQVLFDPECPSLLEMIQNALCTLCNVHIV